MRRRLGYVTQCRAIAGLLLGGDADGAVGFEDCGGDHADVADPGGPHRLPYLCFGHALCPEHMLEDLPLLYQEGWCGGHHGSTAESGGEGGDKELEQGQ